MLRQSATARVFKMKLYTLGTSAGTQPVEGFHHTSTALETNGCVYFFDAGECCAYTAHLCGLDLLKTRAIFITHPHMDHVGGLGNLLWYIRKVCRVTGSPLSSGGNIDIFTPCTESVDGFFTVLKNTEGNFQTDHTHTVRKFADGVIYCDENIKVTANHTLHMPENNGAFQSFSFTVECEGKTVVFSGDMRLEDIERIVPENCDAFFAETGHHRLETVCQALDEAGKNIKKIFFIHNGGYIMRDYPAAVRFLNELRGDGAVICRDGNIYEL